MLRVLPFCNSHAIHSMEHAHIMYVYVTHACMNHPGRRFEASSILSCYCLSPVYTTTTKIHGVFCSKGCL